MNFAHVSANDCKKHEVLNADDHCGGTSGCRDARALIAELEAHLAPLYPAESRHGFSIQKLLQEGWPFSSYATMD